MVWKLPPAGPVICTWFSVPGGAVAAVPVVTSTQLLARFQAPLPGCAQARRSVLPWPPPPPPPLFWSVSRSVPPAPSGTRKKRWPV